MSILSVSLTPDLEDFIQKELQAGHFESKGQIVKKALKKLQEDLVVERLLIASSEAKEGKVLRGDLEDLAKRV